MKLKIVALEKTWAKAVWKSLVKPLGRRVNDSAKAVWRRHRDLLVVLAACSTFFLLVVIADSCALYRSGKVLILPCIHVSSCIVLAREEPCPDLWYDHLGYFYILCFVSVSGKVLTPFYSIFSSCVCIRQEKWQNVVSKANSH